MKTPWARLAVLIGATITLQAGALFAGAPPVGGQFQVNSYTTNAQDYPWVAAGPTGDFVVVWQSYGSFGNDDDLSSIQGQRYASDGTPFGGQFQVNSYTTDDQYHPAVAVAPSGEFVVVWSSDGSTGSDDKYLSVQGQRFSSAGTPLGSQFQVNSYTTGDQYGPSVATDGNGDFVVVWTSEGGSAGADYLFAILGQRFASDGTPQGGEFQVNTYTTYLQELPVVARTPTGGFVVAWQSYGSYGNDDQSFSIQARRFASDGSPQGGEFQVNSYLTAYQVLPSIDVTDDGDFVVAWASEGSYGSDTGYSFSVQGQLYASDGTPLGGQFQINSYTTGQQSRPSVALVADGDFVVAWRSAGSYGSDEDGFSAQGQLFAADGTPVGGEFQINSFTTGDQGSANVASEADGNFVVAWTSAGSYGDDDSSTSIQGQRFGAAIFADGFESGDTSAWSTTVP